MVPNAAVGILFSSHMSTLQREVSVGGFGKEVVEGVLIHSVGYAVVLIRRVELLVKQILLAHTVVIGPGHDEFQPAGELLTIGEPTLVGGVS